MQARKQSLLKIRNPNIESGVKKGRERSSRALFFATVDS